MLSRGGSFISVEDLGISQPSLMLVGCLLLLHMLMYLEMGIVPVILMPVSESFSMTLMTQATLGGVIYLSMGFGGPLSGFLLRQFQHKFVVCSSVYAYILFTVLWALIPTDWPGWSAAAFILLRAAMGLCHSVVSVYVPMWMNQYCSQYIFATDAMRLLQLSVPVGVAAGYILATLVLQCQGASGLCWEMLCWRLPLLINVMAIVPLFIFVYFTPAENLSVLVSDARHNLRQMSKSINSPMSSRPTSHTITKETSSNEVVTAPEKDRQPEQSQIGIELPAVESADDKKRRPLPLLPSSTWIPSVKRKYDAQSPHRIMCDEEAQRRSTNLRRHSIGASFFDPLLTRNVIRKSHENLTLLDRSDNLFAMLQGFRWSNPRHHHQHSTQQQQQQQQRFGSMPDTPQSLASASMSVYPVDTDADLALDLDIVDDSLSLLSDEESEKQTHSPGTAVRWSLDKSPAAAFEYQSLRELRRLPLRPPMLKKKKSVSRLSSVPLTEVPKDPNKQPSLQGIHADLADADKELPEEEYSSSSESSDDDCALLPKDEEIDTVADVPSWRLILRASMRLLTVREYKYLLAAMTAFYFTVTGVQYWGITFFRTNFASDNLFTNFLFILCVISAPLSGIWFGGWLVDLCGGYGCKAERVVALRINILCALIAVVAAVPVTIVDQLLWSLVFLWLMLFFAASMLPSTSGVLVSIVPKEYRPISSSLSVITFNICGYSLSLFSSGLLMQLMAAQQRQCHKSCLILWGFRFILGAMVFVPIFLMLAWIAAKDDLRLSEVRFDEKNLFRSKMSTTSHGSYGSL